jgi:hypothetical protein
MQALIKTKRDGSVALNLDAEAAQAVFASVLFASRFHEGIAPLSRVAEAGLRGHEPTAVERGAICQ